MNIIDEKLHKIGQREEKIKNLPDGPKVLRELIKQSVKEVGKKVCQKRKPIS